MDVNYLHRMLRFMGTGGTTLKHNGSDFCCLDDAIDGSSLPNYFNTWWQKLEFEGWQILNLGGSQFASWYNLKIFALYPAKRNYFNGTVSHACE